MARSVRNVKLDSRTARAKLKPRGKPYWDSLGDKLHLGYRKGKSGGGKWVMRRYLGDGKYAPEETFAEAEDLADADGAEVLTFHQAQTKARERAQSLADEARIAALGPVLTVRDAVEAYAAMRDEREALYGGRKDRNARMRLTKHVLTADEVLSAKPMALLMPDDLAKWCEKLSDRIKAPERTVHDMKAALNLAARRAKAQLPPTIRDTIRDGLARVRAAPSVPREAQVLPDADVRRIISAAWDVDAEGEWDGDLGRPVLALAATGARFSQVIRMIVGDVQVAQKRLMVPVSRKGKGVKNLSYIGVRVGDDVLGALMKATACRKGHEPLFFRPHWRPAAATVGRWEKGERRPWRSTNELTRVWPAIIARAGLAAGTVPYALRHSSIVRGLRAGLPVRLVAALHDTSTPMIERHYAAFIVDALDALAAAAIVPLMTTPATVTPLAAARGW